MSQKKESETFLSIAVNIEYLWKNFKNSFKDSSLCCVELLRFSFDFSSLEFWLLESKFLSTFFSQMVIFFYFILITGFVFEPNLT